MDEEIETCCVCDKEIDILHEPFETFGDQLNGEVYYYHCFCYVSMKQHNGSLGQFMLH